MADGRKGEDDGSAVDGGGEYRGADSAAAEEEERAAEGRTAVAGTWEEREAGEKAGFSVRWKETASPCAPASDCDCTFRSASVPMSRRDSREDSCVVSYGDGHGARGEGKEQESSDSVRDSSHSQRNR